MTTVRIQNQTESLLMVNGLNIRMDSKDSPNSIAVVQKEDLLNPELAQLINLGLVKKLRKTRKKKSTKKTEIKPKAEVKAKPKAEESEPKEPVTPEEIPYEKNSEVIVSQKDGSIVRSKMVQDITGDKETIFIDRKDDESDNGSDDDISDAFLEADEQADNKEDSDDDAFIEV